MREPDVVRLENLIGSALAFARADGSVRPVLSDRYHVLRHLGTGARGVVVEVWDDKIGRRIAAKVVPPRYAGEITTEARATARVEHPNVIRVLDFDVGDIRTPAGRQPCGHVTMDLVEGETLRTWSAIRTRAEILDAYHAAGLALVAVHEARVVHRDFKPDNVMVGRDGRLKLVDFGFAYTRTEDDERLSFDEANRVAVARSIEQSVAMGTRAYIAPEVLAGKISERSDQYSFAVSLWEALAGKHPLEDEADSDDEVEGRFPDVPYNVWMILTQAMSPHSRRRFASMNALLTAIEAARNG